VCIHGTPARVAFTWGIPTDVHSTLEGVRLGLTWGL
jgi:hypothetical protein